MACAFWNSGAVGTIAVQLAAAFGASVTGVCSGRGAHLVRSLGAREVIDYTSEDLADGSRRFDLILDIGGRTSVARLRRAVVRPATRRPPPAATGRVRETCGSR